MDNLVEIQVVYKYYCNNRITPIFMGNEDLLSLTYDAFFSRILAEVPHLEKVASSAESMRLIIVEQDRPEIDISSKYFKSQIMRLLNSGKKTIVIRVAANESPLNSAPAVAHRDHKHSESVKGKRRLYMEQEHNYELENASGPSVHVNVTTGNNSVDNSAIIYPREHDNSHVVLPLERHVKRYEEIVNSLSEQLEKKNKELKELDNKLSTASIQNTGHLSICGNCHLKTGHTRKACHFSPCRTAFSCGILAKHSHQKSLRATIVKEATSLESQLRKAQSDLTSARTAIDRTKNCASNRIKDVLLDENPNRYKSPCGRNNWLLLNKDVALLQGKLKGTLATRTNIMNMLSKVVKEEHSKATATCTNTRKTLQGTDHRVSSQKTALEEEYAIRFPVKRQCKEASSESLFVGEQEKEDFHLALKLQQQEIEIDSDASDGVESVNCSEDEDQIQCEANAAAALLCLKSRRK